VAPNYYPTDPFTWPIRLPTEAEWEKAARGTNGWIYSWGDAYQVGYANIDESGMIGGERQSKTTSVINYVAGASPFGVVDMIGNVMEWCLSEWTDPYHHEVAQAGRIRTKVSRAVRSGSWKTGYTISRAAIRDSWNPVALDNDLGFRVCVSFPMSVDYIPPN
jgi:formylglycine-generating enzyme required for sulfatase activity